MEDLAILKAQYFDTIRATNAFLIKQESIKLRSGGLSHIYLNHNGFLTSFANIGLLASIYRLIITQNVPNGFLVCAVDSVMSPIIVGALSQQAQANVVVVKEQQLTHGMEQQVFGEVNDGEVVVVDDMTSTGSIIINAVNVLRKANAVVRYAVVSACRDTTAETRLQELGVTLLSIASFEEILRDLWDQLSADERQLVSVEYGQLGNS